MFQGSILRKTRICKKMPLLRLSKLTGISRNQLILLESDKSTNPRSATIGKLASALSVPISTFADEKLLCLSETEFQLKISELEDLYYDELEKALDHAMLDAKKVITDNYQEEFSEIEARFPCPFDLKKNISQGVKYYNDHLEAENAKLRVLLKNLQKEYNIPNLFIDELYRVSENTSLLREYVLNLKVCIPLNDLPPRACLKTEKHVLF